MSQPNPNDPSMWQGRNHSQKWWDEWKAYFDSWGSKNASNIEAEGVLTDLRTNIANEETQLLKYMQYKAENIPWSDQAIAATQSTIDALNQAITQKLKEYQSEGLNVT